MEKKKPMVLGGSQAAKVYTSSPAPVKKTGGCGCGKKIKKQ
ncbi:hypothetical protein HNR43_000188 [Anoxybacillus mongoliensis]|uniref:Uncharacterized protein n=1 Tax=Anoxybacillus mongoliensis TaxID=452565 RepID=A0A7W8JCJ5_9BACL|nr:hypothetical protein [Anoxybacillus mongoliensis]MBB5354233.1 hypothetical protein [Anoxybacillus mongoliensis]